MTAELSPREVLLERVLRMYSRCCHRFGNCTCGEEARAALEIPPVEGEHRTLALFIGPLTMRPYVLPVAVGGALHRYATERQIPGDFLQACIAGDFIEAALRADGWSMRSMGQIAHYITAEIPADGRGSRAAIALWATL